MKTSKPAFREDRPRLLERMTMRQYYKAAALQAFAAYYGPSGLNPETVATACATLADAMLAEDEQNG